MAKPFCLGGEFERDAWPRDSVDEARQRFMKMCVGVEPQVLRSLLQDATWAESLAGGDPPSPMTAHEALGRWGETWQLSEPWCLDWACLQVALRGAKKRGLWPPPNRAHAIAANLVFGNVKLVSGPPLKTEAFRFESAGWEIEQDDRRSFEAQTKKEFVAALKAYGDENEQRAEREGMLRTPELRTEHHFNWLARYQVKGERFADIAANTAALTPKAVEVAVKRLAKFIGLTLRKPRTR